MKRKNFSKMFKFPRIKILLHNVATCLEQKNVASRNDTKWTTKWTAIFIWQVATVQSIDDFPTSSPRVRTRNVKVYLARLIARLYPNCKMQIEARRSQMQMARTRSHAKLHVRSLLLYAAFLFLEQPAAAAAAARNSLPR